MPKTGSWSNFCMWHSLSFPISFSNKNERIAWVEFICDDSGSLQVLRMSNIPDSIM